MRQHIRANRRIGENIRRLRSAKGITQEQLCAKLQVGGCDISRGTLAKIEAGIRHISVEELAAVKNVLESSYEEILQ
ncbi:MAG TPA: helix-turn-helix transcriptional regulator [Feifaniaceae bacterium]|nr:helix-turn-helix transcriptional regulator [Feifaniaceae bacterium]